MGKPGPKAQRDLSPLPFDPEAFPTKGDAFAAFCREFIITPKGRGARDPFIVRDWQKAIVNSVLDPTVRMQLVVMPRGQGKSTLTAALALYHILCEGIEGARAVVVAQDERSAQRLVATAARMVALHPELECRLNEYKDRIHHPATDSVIVGLPAEAARIEGEDASLAILDEVGYCRRDSYEALLHSTGKREESKLLMIGTPSVPSWRETSPMLDLVLEGRTTSDPTFRLIEYSSDITHPVDCEHCWEMANPGLDDLVSRDALRGYRRGVYTHRNVPATPRTEPTIAVTLAGEGAFLHRESMLDLLGLGQFNPPKVRVGTRRRMRRRCRSRWN